jgi:hypothetical protein
MSLIVGSLALPNRAAPSLASPRHQCPTKMSLIVGSLASPGLARPRQATPSPATSALRRCHPSQNPLPYRAVPHPAKPHLTSPNLAIPGPALPRLAGLQLVLLLEKRHSLPHSLVASRLRPLLAQLDYRLDDSHQPCTVGKHQALMLPPLIR